MTDKFSHLPGPIADRYRSWEADAIEKCRNDPRVAALNLCYVCMCSLPDCLCVRQRRPPVIAASACAADCGVCVLMDREGRMIDRRLTDAQIKALQSAVRTGSPTSHLSGMADWGGWGSTRVALQKRGYLDSGCVITPAGRAAIGADT